MLLSAKLYLIGQLYFSVASAYTLWRGNDLSKSHNAILLYDLVEKADVKLFSCTSGFYAVCSVIINPDDIEADIAEFRHEIEQNSSPSTARRNRGLSDPVNSQTDTQAIEVGIVLRHSKDKTYGFIKSDRTSLGKDIFFHLRCLVDKGPLPNIGQRVQFFIIKTEKGLKANGVCAEQKKPTCRK